MRYAAAGAVDEAGYFLNARARRTDDADITASHHIGKCQWEPPDNGGAAIGAQKEQAALLCFSLAKLPLRSERCR